MDSYDPRLPLGRAVYTSIRNRSPTPGPSRDRSDSTATLSDRRSSQNYPPASQDPASQRRLSPPRHHHAPDPHHVVSHPGDPYHPVLPQHGPILPQQAYPTTVSRLAHPQSPVWRHTVPPHAVSHHAVWNHAASQEPTGYEQAASPPPIFNPPVFYPPVFLPAFQPGQSREIPYPPPPFAPGHEHLLHFPSPEFPPGNPERVLRNPPPEGALENFKQSNDPRGPFIDFPRIRAPPESDGGDRHTAIRMTVPFPMRCACGEPIDAGVSLLGRSMMLSNDDEYLRDLQFLRFFLCCPRCHGKMYFRANSMTGEYECVCGVSPLSDPAPVLALHPDPEHPRRVLGRREADECAVLRRQSGEFDVEVEDLLARMRRP